MEDFLLKLLVRFMLVLGLLVSLPLLSLSSCSCKGREGGQSTVGLGTVHSIGSTKDENEHSPKNNKRGKGAAMINKIQEPALAGTWYPADPDALSLEIAGYLGEYGESGKGKRKVASQTAGIPVGLVVPHAGYRFSGEVAGRVWASVLDKGHLYSRVLILAPAHRYPLHGVALPDVSAFATPLGLVEVDEEARTRIMELASGLPVSVQPKAFHQEHSIEVQLPFLKKSLPSTPIVPLLVGSISLEHMKSIADILKQVMGRDTLVVVSTDFTHYGVRFNYRPFHASTMQELRTRLWVLDMGAVNMVTALSIEGLDNYIMQTGITICGRYSLLTALTLLDGIHNNNRLGVRMLGYDTSLSKGDDPSSGAVTYAGLAIYRNDPSLVAIMGDGDSPSLGEGLNKHKNTNNGDVVGEGGDDEGEGHEDDLLPSISDDIPAEGEWDEEGEGAGEETLDEIESGIEGEGEVVSSENSRVSTGRNAGSLFAMDKYILLPSEKKTLTTYARSSLEAGLSGRGVPVLAEEQITPRLSSRLGAFVTLKKDGRLRGCIGRFTGDAGENPLYRVVSSMAVAAALEDSRFPQVTAEELKELDMEISVLGPLTPIEPEDVVVGRDGLLLVKGWNRGVLLPQVPVEQGWNRVQYLEFLAQKASLPKDGWRGGQLYAFQAQVFSE